MAHLTLPKKPPLENRAVLPAARHGRNNFLSGLKVRDEGARTC